MKGFDKILCAFLSAVLFLFSSCSIIDDRSECPCIVRLDFSSVQSDSIFKNGSEGVVYIFAFNHKNGERVNVATLDFPLAEALVKTNVPKGDSTDLSVVITKKSSNYLFGISETHIPLGEQPDSIYGFHTLFDSKCDQQDIKVEMHKQFSTIRLESCTSRPSQQLVLTVLGECDGLNLRSMDGASGSFIYSPDTTSKKYWTFRIPRQSSPVLKLQVTDTAGVASAVETMDLARALVNAGYKFRAEDLQDMEMKLEVVDGTVNVSVKPWDGRKDIEQEF